MVAVPSIYRQLISLWITPSTYIMIYSIYMINTLLMCFTQGSINFKFGVVYAKENQVSDEEFYSNGTYCC